MERLVLFEDFQADKEGEEELMVLEQTHAHVAIEDLSELILQHEGPLLHLNKLLLLGHVVGCLPGGLLLLFASLLVDFIVVLCVLRLFFIVGTRLWNLERLSEEALEPAHRELIHVVEQLEVLHCEVKSGSLLSRHLKLLTQVSDLFLVVFGLFEFLFDLLCRLLRLF